MDSPRKAWSYLRLSTDAQLRGSGLPRQLEASRAYAQANGLELVESLQDVGLSGYTGANVEGGELGRFLELVRARRVERGSVLIVENIDRLSRQAVFKSLSLLVELVNAGIEVHTLGDGRIYGTTTGVGDLIVSLIGMERSYNESQTKSLRIRDSWKRRRANAHQKPMTSMARSWLRRDKDGRFELIEERAAIIRQIHEWCAGGVGIYAITARLNRSGVRPFGKSNGWHQSYVARVLKDRAVLGELQPHRDDDGRRVPEGDVIADYYPAVVDADTFYRSQSAVGSRRNRGAGRKGANVTNLFSGLTVCAYCHSKLHVVSKGSGPKGGRYLVCDASRRGLACEAGGWRLEQFETSFLSFVREAEIGSLVRDESKAGALDGEVAALRGRLASISEQMEKTYALLDTAPDFVARKLRELEAQRVQLGTELKVKEAERAELESSRRRFEEGRDEIKALIERLRGSGDEAYRLRASIAARLQSIVDTILVAPAGSAPKTRSAIEFLRGQKDSAPVIEHMESTIDGRRYFNVVFKESGAMRAVYPDPSDPARFTMQLTSSRESGVVRHTPDASTTVFAPRSFGLR